MCQHFRGTCWLHISFQCSHSWTTSCWPSFWYLYHAVLKVLHGPLQHAHSYYQTCWLVWTPGALPKPEVFSPFRLCVRHQPLLAPPTTATWKPHCLICRRFSCCGGPILHFTRSKKISPCRNLYYSSLVYVNQDGYVNVCHGYDVCYRHDLWPLGFRHEIICGCRNVNVHYSRSTCYMICYLWCCSRNMKQEIQCIP